MSRVGSRSQPGCGAGSASPPRKRFASKKTGSEIPNEPLLRGEIPFPTHSRQCLGTVRIRLTTEMIVCCLGSALGEWHRRLWPFQEEVVQRVDSIRDIQLPVVVRISCILAWYLAFTAEKNCKRPKDVQDVEPSVGVEDPPAYPTGLGWKSASMRLRNSDTMWVP